MNPAMHSRISRRQLLRRSALGFGNLALMGLMSPGLRARGSEIQPNPLAPRAPLFRSKAKRIIFLFMHGGPSHVDTFDWKPRLLKDSGKPLPFDKPRIQFAKTSNLRRSPWEFRPYGQSGAMISDLFPLVGARADDLCFIKSIHGTNEAHGGALLKLNTGSDTVVRPSMGSWITYGLGTENQNLPAFVVMHGQRPRGDDQIWSTGFLPKTYQALALDAGRREAIDNILRVKDETDDQQRAALDFLRDLNSTHAQTRPSQADLAARINSFELAYRMQAAAPEALDFERESEETKKLYGVGDKNTDPFARQCLIARRLIERGVRYIQIFAGRGASGDGSVGDVPWDGHDNIEKNHRSCAAATDQPAAALLADLKSRGLLDSTLVIWGGEFGRTSDSQGSLGRDHNPHAFTIWMAGGGTRGGGFHYGATDEFGYKAVEKKVHVNDLHATILHLMGLDHEKLTYRHNGRDFRLTDVGGHVLREILA